METLSIDRRTDGVAVVTLDDPIRPVNALGVELLAEFEDRLVPLAADPDVKALVLLSAKEDTFIAGADIKAFNQTDNGALVSELDGAYSRALSALARGPKPVVAAVHGAALGGGLEVVLACHYIMATDHPSTVLGLPEVQLGILPAAGGTQRLPARVGLMTGLNMMLTGQRVRAAKALALGLIDEIIDREHLKASAIKRARALAAGRLQRPARKRSFTEKLISLPGVRSLVFNQVRKQVLRRTRGNYPGPLRIVDCVQTGLARGEDAAFELEIKSIGELFTTPQARSLIWLFVAGTDLKAAGGDGQGKAVERLAVLGAGLRGSGIAAVSLARAPVVVRDLEDAALERCRLAMEQGLEKQQASGAITQAEAQRRRGSLSLTTAIEGVAGCDLVIEAVYDDLELKRLVLASSEEVIGPQAVYGSSTSFLPISQIAAQAKHPERVVGLHYFSPVPRVPLLELVAPEAAAPWAVDTARAWGQAQGKTVVRVKDRPGFYTTRILTPYLGEALRLVCEGAAVAAVDGALKDFGFSEGPLQMIDRMGIDALYQAAEYLGGTFAARWDLPLEDITALMQAGCRGRKNRRGLYTYSQSSKPKANPEALRLLAHGGQGQATPSQMVDRTVLLMINEAAHCLAEGVIANPTHADLAAVMGLGFPPFRGGPFHHVDQVGAAIIVGNLEDLASRLGPRYTPAGPLAEAARNGGRFFPQPN